MRKLHMVLLGTFLAGVLMAGIGTGIAFGEYSSFEYDGTVYLGEEVTEEIDYSFNPSEDEAVLLNYCQWGDRTKDTLIVEDASIPIGVVRYKVTYNEKLVRPELIFWDVENEKSERRVVVELAGNYLGDDFTLLMENKDKILEGLKQKKIASYTIDDIMDVEILVNPESMPYLDDYTRKHYY